MSEFAETFPETGCSRIENIESLHWLQRRLRMADGVTYLVQIVNQPHQIIVLKARHTSLILFPVKGIGELVVEPRRGPVETAECL